MKKTLAIFSPNEHVYSETFIQAHKELPFAVRYYYGGWLPIKLEDGGNLFHFSILEKIKIRLYRSLSITEHAVANSLKKEKAAVVLAEYGPTACAILNVVKYLKLPLVVHFHGFDASHKKTLTEYEDQYKNIFAYANSILVVSTRMKDDLIKLGCPKKKIIMATYGPLNSFFDIQPVYKKQQFVSIGRFINKKAPGHTIAAFKKVADKFPSATLIMVGNGQLLNECRNLARELKLQEKIKFSGVLKPAEIQSLLSESLAFVQHSVIAEDGDSEGTPVAVLEAQAAALPVVATWHAGIPDVVIHNETGLLGQEHDVDEMATNMMRLLQEEGLAKRLGEAGRKRIKDNFSLDKHLSILARALHDAIRQKQSDN